MNWFNCMSCRKLTLLFEGEEAKCHTCGGHGEVLSAEQFEKGHASGVFFGIGPKGKRTKVEPGQQLLVKVEFVGAGKRPNQRQRYRRSPL